MELDQLETLGVRGLFLEQTLELLNQPSSGPNACTAMSQRVVVPSLRHIVFDMVDEILFDSDEAGCIAVRQFLEQRSLALHPYARNPFRFTLTGSSISVETVRQLMDSRWSSLFIVDNNATGGTSINLAHHPLLHAEAAMILRQFPCVRISNKRFLYTLCVSPVSVLFLFLSYAEMD
jgi:hypothetical protein